jgi:2-(1,2-epoxy-1,2-dihydrophenyl)acetyl-CoA isomerase
VSPLVLLEQTGELAVLTLNRPERHNSLIPALLSELLDGLEAIRERSDLRVVILQANGKSFSTGGDVRAFYDNLHDLESYANLIVSMLNQVILAMFDLRIPIIAAIRGIVTGGSLGMVLASDIVLVTPQASFAPFYSVVGFSPDGGWSALLPSLIGPKRVSEIIMLNKVVTAENAVDWGLASRIVAQEDIDKEARQTAQKISGMCAQSIRQTKRLLLSTYGDIPTRLEQERYQFVKQVMTVEAREGMARFLGIDDR